MPQFQLDIGSFEDGKIFAALDEFTQGYIEAMFFTANEEIAEPKFSGLAPETLARIEADCAKFQANLPRDGQGRSALDLAYDYAPIDYDARHAGTDFWFTRNHHGAGYWDRGLGPVGDKLTEAARAFGECDLYQGDNGRLYL